MDKDKDPKTDTGRQDTTENRGEKRSGSFNEPDNMDRKSTTNIEEEADLEQQRKEALTERD
jgi:hypothetical protein